jgi:hypothetical protein
MIATQAIAARNRSPAFYGASKIEEHFSLDSIHHRTLVIGTNFCSAVVFITPFIEKARI